MLLPGKILSTDIKSNRAGVDLLTCIVRIRKDQNITGEWIGAVGEASAPIIGEAVVVAPKEQSFGGYLVFGFVNVFDALFCAPGVKLIFGRDGDGKIKTKITLDESDIFIENAVGTTVVLSGDNIILNEGSGQAVEINRLQTAINSFSAIIQAEFVKVAAGTEPNPSAPYVPSTVLPSDISAAKSETVKLPSNNLL